MRERKTAFPWSSTQLQFHSIDLFGIRLNNFIGMGIHVLLWICIFSVIIGIIVRTTNFFFADISFWNDEAAFALNIVHKDFVDLFKTMEHSQVAPIGFCLFEKLSVGILGDTETALRLLPYLAGTIAIGLVFIFVHNAAGFWPALLCAAQLAVIKEPIFYSNNLKPYASDIAIALALMLIAWKSDGARSSWLQLLFIAISGVIAIWFSFPTVFVLGGIGAMWLMDWLSEPRKKPFFILTAICSLWLISFWLQFRLLQTQSSNAYLLEFWREHFLPLAPKTLADLEFFVKLPGIFRNPLWTGLPLISSILFISGCLIIWKHNRRLLVLIVVPLMLNLIASSFKKYPFGDRMLQYGIMNLFIPISISLVFLFAWCSEKKWQKIIVMLLIICNLAEPAVNAAKNIFVPKKREQVKQIVEQLAIHESGDEPYYIFGSSFYTYKYYMERMGVKPQLVVVGPVVSELDHTDPKEELSALHGHYWMLFGHAKQHNDHDYEKDYIQEADRRGTLLEKIIDFGGSAYLYNFPKPLPLSSRQKLWD
jgi:hypothetical protein